MKILQVGKQDWSIGLELPENIEWYVSQGENLEQFLEDLKAEELAKIPQDKLEEMDEQPDIHLRFDSILVTESVSEEYLNYLIPTIEAYTLFHTEDAFIFQQTENGIYRRKIGQILPFRGEKREVILSLHRTLFSGQYGAKLKLPDVEVASDFTGDVSYDGNVGIIFEGHFGEDFEPLFSFRYNLSAFEMALEIWPEYIKEGDCQLEMVVDSLKKGSIGEVVETLVIGEDELKEPYILKSRSDIGFYFVSFRAKGNGKLKFGATHWRYSREGLGRFVLGGKRHVDSKRQEIFTYFNPGDLQPPLNVYFSGFRQAEGFEGFYMMKSMGAPFVLVADPRLEGGCFYSGTEELENKVVDAIQEALDYLGFTNQQLILSGLSMGAFGALYNSAKLEPHAVVVGKPFTNLGGTVVNLKLKRPDEFETSGDMIRNVVGGSDDLAIEAFDNHFWKVFKKGNFAQTKFAIAFMEQDDYDGHAIDRLVEYLADTDAHLFAKGYEGRHNDNSRAINRWFLAQYHKFLRTDFGRTL
ncbi:TPA: accessory Sec system protein Asp2 [Streptococcus suis]